MSATSQSKVRHENESRRFFTTSPSGLAPVILLGGLANALSVARSLGKLGVPVYLLNDGDSVIQYSRYCKLLPIFGGKEAWAKFLLGPESEVFRGSVLLTCSDDGIEILAEHRDALGERFLIDIMNVESQFRMLNKLDTYEAATAAGVPTPNYWVVGESQGDEIEQVLSEAVFPLIVKPRLSHVCEGITGRKLYVANNRRELADGVNAVQATGAGALIMELIPGLDDQLCSYFTYLDEESRPLFHFTKRIIRRYPILRGTACYHVTDKIPEAVELGVRLFQHVGLQGVANVEFKHDARDGRLKLIECNARFTASNGLVASSGIDLGLFVYHRLTGRPLPRTDEFEVGRRLWDPIRDFQSYLELRKTGELTFGEWVKSVCHRQTFPYLEWSDPLPALRRLANGFAKQR